MTYFILDVGCALEEQAAPVRTVGAMDRPAQCPLWAQAWLSRHPHKGGASPTPTPRPRVGRCSDGRRVSSTSCQAHSTSRGPESMLPPPAPQTGGSPKPLPAPFLAHLRLVGQCVSLTLLRATWKGTASPSTGTRPLGEHLPLPGVTGHGCRPGFLLPLALPSAGREMCGRLLSYEIGSRWRPV